VSDPAPDLIDICVVLNEASDTRLGTNLLPYAARVKAIVIEALAAEAEAEPFMDFSGDWERSSSEGFADWLRSHLPTSDVTT
jgi:hypothetical protein